ncbi:hypothetical protein SAMN05216203_1467 [Marinobacter daqiaonensis]|uniref:Uncharacterized protein n=1 Tax=Marinobacter daqiaonensis TaxID=650891 RepID=A0A1I6HS11_9GAMM|nr:hypothetical protein SAMN05216203_1467 [Marinobacter daqiaonensis]
MKNLATDDTDKKQKILSVFNLFICDYPCRPWLKLFIFSLFLFFFPCPSVDFVAKKVF